MFQKVKQKFVTWYAEARLIAKISVWAIAGLLLLGLTGGLVSHLTYHRQTQAFLYEAGKKVPFDPRVTQQAGMKPGAIVANAIISEINGMLYSGWFGYQPNKPWRILLPDNLEYTQLGKHEALYFFVKWFNESGVATMGDKQAALLQNVLGKLGREPKIFWALPNSAMDYASAIAVLEQYIQDLNAGQASAPDIMQRQPALASVLREAMRRMSSLNEDLIHHDSLFGTDAKLYKAIGEAQVTYTVLSAIRIAMEPTLKTTSPDATVKFDETLEALREAAEYKPLLALSNDKYTRALPVIDDTLREHSALLGYAFMKLSVATEMFASRTQ